MISPDFETLLVGGIKVYVFGLDQLKNGAKPVISCVFVLHGRLGNSSDMHELARSICEPIATESSPANEILISVCFDQRNHGSRLQDLQRNRSWKAGNKTHATDMWSIQ